MSFIICVHNNYEDLELHYPKYRLKEAGLKVQVAGPEQDIIYKAKHGYPCKSEIDFDSLKAREINGIIIPGGFAPDKLRTHKKLLELVRETYQAFKLVAFICHGGWVPLSAGILNKVECTSAFSIKDDLTNGGALWKDLPCVVDRNVISSRGPDDLPFFCKEILNFLHQTQK